jgi:serine/threonine protein kinase
MTYALSQDPHVVRLLDLKQDINKEGQTILYLVFEYMDTDLKKFIRGYHANHEKIPAQTVKVNFLFLYPLFLSNGTTKPCARQGVCVDVLPASA